MFFEVKCVQMTFIVGVFYRPPKVNAASFSRDMDSILRGILSVVSRMVGEIVCLGDFNFNLFNQPNPLDYCFDAYNFSQIVTVPTRVSGSSCALLDPIFITNEDLVSTVNTICADEIFNHRLVYCVLNVVSDKIIPRHVIYRSFANFNSEEFLADLYALNWFDIVYKNNIDQKIRLFNQFILMLFDKHAPLVTRRISKTKAPWITPNLKKS